MKGFSENYWAMRSNQYDKVSWVKDTDFIDAFLGMLKHVNYNTILEVGVGTGAMAKQVADRIGPLTGIDISQEMIDQIDHPGVTPMVANAHDLPFDNASFEMIYMRNVIHYIDNPILAFSEIHRCMKKGGTFLFSQVIPPDDSISKEYDWLVGRDIHYPTKSEILRLFSIFSGVLTNDFVLEDQSIINWLDNTCDNEEKKQNIIDRHHSTSDKYRAMANYQETENDILVNIKHLIVIGEK